MTDLDTLILAWYLITIALLCGGWLLVQACRRVVR